MRNSSFEYWRFRLSILGSVALLSVVTFASPPQQVQEPPPPATAPTAQTSEPGFKLGVQKNEVVVRVVVRDSKGHAVGGLKKEDFTITDNKKPQEIGSFSVESSEAGAVAPQLSPAATGEKPGLEVGTAPAAPLTYLAFYLDDLSSSQESLNRAGQAAEKFLAGLPENEWVAIFTVLGSPSLDFTDDRQKIHEALLKLRKITRPILRRCPVLNTLDAVIGRLAAMPGERQVLLVSDGFAFSPDHPDPEGQILLQRAIDHAVRARVTISWLYGAGLAMEMPELDTSVSDSLPPEEDAMRRLQRRLRRGTGAPSDSPPPDDTLLVHSLDFKLKVLKEGTLAEITNGTGGQYVYETNDLLGGLRKILLPPEVSYVLTFSPTDLKADGAFHDLKVTLANGRGLSIQARRGYFAPQGQAALEELAKNEIREAVYSQDAIQDLPLTFETQARKAEGQNEEIEVQAVLDVRDLPFEKQGDLNLAKVVFAVGLFDHDGKYVTGSQQTYSLSLKDATRVEMEKRGLSLKTHVSAKTGAYTVRVIVRDSQGGKMAASSKTVEVPL